MKFGGADPALLNWSGENGLGRGLIGAAITLGSLKGTGAFVQGQNPILQHLFQDSAMVLAHHVSGIVGITDRPRESFAEQMVHAEATLWQINAGMSLVHGAFPRLGQVERGLDLSARVHDIFKPHLYPPLDLKGRVREGLRSLEPLPALAGDVIIKEVPKDLHIQKMTAQGSDGEVDFKVLAKEAKKNPEALDFLKLLAQNRNPQAMGAIAQAAEESSAAARLLMEFSFQGNAPAAQMLFQLRMEQHIQRAFHHRDPIYLLRDLALLGHEDAQSGLLEVAKNRWEALQVLLHVGVAGAIFAQRALPDLDVSAYAPRARMNDEVPRALKALAWQGNVVAFEILADSAEVNPHAVQALYDLAQRNHRASKKIMAQVPVKTLAKKARKDREALKALQILAGSHNEAALKALVYLDEKNEAAPPENLLDLLKAAKRNNREAIRRLYEMALKGHEGALLTLAEAAEKRPEAVFALIELDGQGLPRVRRPLQQLNLRNYRMANPNRGEKGKALRVLAQIGHREALEIFVSWAALYRTTPALTFLGELAAKGHRGALRGLAEAARRNPNAVKILVKLHQEGEEEAQRLLRNLKDLHYYRSLSLFGEEESFQTLCLLTELGNQEAYQALVESLEYNRSQVESLKKSAQEGKEFALWVLNEASQYTPIAVLALVDLAKEGNRLAQNRVSALRVRPLLERATKNRFLQKETFEAIDALKELGNPFAEEALKTLPTSTEESYWNWFLGLLKSAFKGKPKS